MKRKNILCILLCLILIFSLVSCGESDEERDARLEQMATDIMGMSPVLGAISYTDCNFPDAKYNTGDTNYWKNLYVLINLYGTNNEDIVFDLNGIQVPTAVVKEYSKALYADFDGTIPEMPYGSVIYYDGTTDCYVIPWFDAMLDTRCKIESMENDEYVVYAETYDMSSGETLIASRTFTLVENTDSEIFKFSVKSVE